MSASGLDLRQVEHLIDEAKEMSALGVDHVRYALRTTSIPGRAYSAIPDDKGLSRCPRFFEVPPKDTSAELPSDVSLVAQTG